MIMWILALVLMAVTIGTGYRQGATRVAITLVGLIAAAFLALPLAPLFRFVFRFIDVHPVLPEFLTPIIAFVAVSIIFKIIASFVFRKVDFHYRYHVSDTHRVFWERMHRRVGACLGALNGLIYFLVIALVIYIAGYFTIQTGGAESGSKVLSYVTKAAEDLRDTDMQKVVGPLSPAPLKYYQASDILGLLYHNRPLINRAENYPVFAAMSDRPQFQAMAADRDFQRMIQSPSTLEDLLANPKIQEVATNAELYNEFMSVDLNDLQQYLDTGVSPKFSGERILGRWAYNAADTLKLNKAANSEVPASTWFRIKNELTERFNGTVFTAYYDNKAALKLSPSMEGRPSPLLPGVRLPSGQTNRPPRWSNTNAMYSASGKWSGSAPDYLVTLGSRSGTATSEAKLENDRISFRFQGAPMSFDRLPE